MQVRQLADARAFSAEKLRKHGLFQTPRFFLDVYCLGPGQSQAPHLHADSDKIYLVLEGQARVEVDAEAEVLGPGAAVLAPAGSRHGVHNPGPEGLRLLVLMAPPPLKLL